MAKPAYERVGAAFRTAYKAAGLRQVDIADALGVNQSSVSRWANGLEPIEIEYFPKIDELCGQPLGYLLDLAGYVSRDPLTVEEAIARDPNLTPDNRAFVLRVYRFATQDSAALVK